MSEDYRPFASYLRFKEILADPMGHLYRAAEFDVGGIIRTVWLGIFDGPDGAVDEVAVITDRDTGRPRGFGFVEVDDSDLQTMIQNLDGKELGGRAMRVNEAQDRKRGGGGSRW